jgi:hypothetical protein
MQQLPARFTPLPWAALPASTTAAKTASATRSTTTAAARGLRPRFINIQSAPANIRAIQCRNCSIRLFRIRHFDECKSPRAASFPVRHQAHALHGTIRFKQRANRIFRRAKIQIPYEYVLQCLLLLTG